MKPQKKAIAGPRGLRDRHRWVCDPGHRPRRRPRRTTTFAQGINNTGLPRAVQHRHGTNINATVSPASRRRRCRADRLASRCPTSPSSTARRHRPAELDAHRRGRVDRRHRLPARRPAQLQRLCSTSMARSSTRMDDLLGQRRRCGDRSYGTYDGGGPTCTGNTATGTSGGRGGRQRTDRRLDRRQRRSRDHGIGHDAPPRAPRGSVPRDPEVDRQQLGRPTSLPPAAGTGVNSPNNAFDHDLWPCQHRRLQRCDYGRRFGTVQTLTVTGASATVATSTGQPMAPNAVGRTQPHFEQDVTLTRYAVHCRPGGGRRSGTVDVLQQSPAAAADRRVDLTRS